MAKNRNNYYNQQKQSLQEELAQELAKHQPEQDEQTAQVDHQAEHQEPEHVQEQQAQEPVVPQEPEVQAEPVLRELPEHEVQKLQAAAEQIAQQLVPQPQVANPPKTADRIMNNLTNDLTGYIDAMRPNKSVTVEVGGGWQTMLFKTLKRVVENQDPEAFKAQWNFVLNVFNQNKDLFNERYIYRFQAGFKGSAKDFQTFRYLTTLAMRTCNPQTRAKDIKDIVLERITSTLSPVAANNITSFYG